MGRTKSVKLGKLAYFKPSLAKFLNSKKINKVSLRNCIYFRENFKRVFFSSEWFLKNFKLSVVDATYLLPNLMCHVTSKTLDVGFSVVV